MKVLSVFGTRPEAIKMAPVIAALHACPAIESKVCITGQHRQMLDQMLTFFGIACDYDLNLMQPNQSLTTLTANITTHLEPIIRDCQPDWVLVQGDTTTAFVSALCAFYQKVPVAHIEAGLRTYNPYLPWPEEMNRKLVGSLASLHFAPTLAAANNLRQEHIPNERIHVVGNTVIDTLLATRKRFETDSKLGDGLATQFKEIDWSKRVILVTGHRRESWENGLQRMCQALTEIAKRDDVQIVYPVHLNEKVQKVVSQSLRYVANIHLIPPLDYLPFVYLLAKCTFVITDSGGIQEEAPSFGKPVLVTRDTTERPEGVMAGNAQLVGTNPKAIIEAASALLDNPAVYSAMSQARNPYGDGSASKRIVAILQRQDRMQDRLEQSIYETSDTTS